MPELNDKITKEYDASQIQVLEGLEAVRPASGYVHRVHLLQRPAPPGL
jgi:hypothetical protein